MTNYTPLSSADGFNLDGDDKLYIGRNVQISSAYAGLSTAGSNNVIYVDGTLAGTYGGYLFTDSTINVFQSGNIFGFEIGFYTAYQTGNVINNAGDIYGGAEGLNLVGGVRVNNTGTISSGSESFGGVNAAIAISLDGSTIIRNSGLIQAEKAGSNAIQASGSSTENIINSGKIIGNILLGGGNDSFSTSNGTVSGMIDGGSGNDRIFGSAFADKITGGIGQDVLSGNAGADLFVFKDIADSTVSSANRDTIQDFSISQHDRIDLRTIDAIQGGSNQSFHFIGAKAFTESSGELRSVISGANTIVSGDTNGDGAADFSILLKGAMTLHSGDFIL